MIPDRLGYFSDDFWNFGYLVKIWTRGPPNHYQTCFQKKRNMESSRTILFLSIWDSCFFFPKIVCHRYHVFCSCSICSWKLEYIVLLHCCGDEDREMIISINKINKSLDMNFISIKNMKCFFCNLHKNIFWTHKTFLKPRNQTQETFFPKYASSI